MATHQGAEKEGDNNEFGADDASAIILDTGSEFGRNYKKCRVENLIAEGKAWVNIFFLYDDPRVLDEMIKREDVYLALKFINKAK